MMNKFWKLVCILVCVIVSIGTLWLLCDQKKLSNNMEGLITKRVPIEETNLENARLENGTLIIEDDPQIIVNGVNTFIKEIRLEGVTWQEEIQIFYTHGSEQEGFTEESSIYITPEIQDNDLIFMLEREVSSLRIDLNGERGKKYDIKTIVINPTKYFEFNLKLFVLSMSIGIVIGLCLVVLISKRSYLKLYLCTLRQYHYLLEDMVVRDIKLKYRRSIIGLLWSILNPLLMMIVITAVFQNLFRFTVEHFEVYYLTGWLIFNFVTEATTGAMTSILNGSVLIRKVYIPKYIFPVQKCVFSFVNMLFSLVALLIVMMVLQIDITWKMLLIPIPLLLAFIFSIGIGMVLSAITVFFRDLIHLYNVFTMVWMYLTPIIYPMDILPNSMLKIIKFNPMYYFVDYFRNLTLYGKIPELFELLILLFWAMLSLIVGILVFKKKQDRFILFI